MQKFIAEPVDIQENYVIKRYNEAKQVYELFAPQTGFYYSRTKAEELARWHNANIG